MFPSDPCILQDSQGYRRGIADMLISSSSFHQVAFSKQDYHYSSKKAKLEEKVKESYS